MNDQKVCARKQSILESEIEALREESLKVNSISDSILNTLRPSPPCGPSCEQTSSGTVADELRNARTITEGTKLNLTEIQRILEDQLGGLRLEY